MGQRGTHAAIDSLYAALVAATLSLALFMGDPTHAKGTAAGVDITNTATVAYIDRGVPRVVTSDPYTFKVEEILDVVVATVSDTKIMVSAAETKRPFAFRVTNSGNGEEAFALSPTTAIAGDDFDPAQCAIAIDANDNGTYETSDIPYVAGSNDPVLDADEAIIVFTLCDMPGTLEDSSYAWVDLYATATTKTDPLDPKGTIYDAPPDGIDAVVGATTARAPARGGYLTGVSPPRITKGQEVTKSPAGSAPVPGAEITYTLTAELRGGGITNAVIADPIPNGTSYVPGSLELSKDGGTFIKLTDSGQDSDAGKVTDTGVEVALGAAPVPRTHKVKFRVKINQ